jgi:hypothetical protein
MAGPGVQAWLWSADGVNVTQEEVEEWGNLVEGLRLTGAGAIDGIWASTNDPTPSPAAAATEADQCPHRRLRTNVTANPIQMQQAAEAVALEGSHQHEIAVVLGCPGGRVRVLHVLANDWRIDDSTDHAQSALWSSQEDLGFGGAALAVRGVPGTGGVDIWFGTFCDPTTRPQDYGNPLGTGSLSDAEVATGAVHRFSWQPGQNPVRQQSVAFHPTSAEPRGAHGVTGLCVADLLPGSAGDELIVATMSGDLIVLSADTMQEIWRTHVDGSIGFYNGIRVEDLNGDGHMELYVAGSKGLWRFVTPQEGPSQ